MSEFKLGDRVLISGHKSGVVAYIGKTKFRPGEWFGIELSNPNGKNDGSVEGTRYFQCKPKHGLFVRRSQIRIQIDDIVPKKKNTEQLEHCNVSSPSKLSPNIVEKLEIPTIKVGDRIILKGGRTGTLSYLGKTDFKPGIWAGVELDDTVGKHDGCVKGKRYFQCKPLHGLFVKFEDLGLATNMRSETSSSTMLSENTRSLKDPADKMQSSYTPDQYGQYKSNRSQTIDYSQQFPSTDTDCVTLSPSESNLEDLNGILQSAENTGNSRLKMYYDRIVQETELDKGVMDYLISLCVMSTEDREEVNMEPTTSGRNRIVLDILIDRPYETWRNLKEALQMDSNYSELVNELDFSTEIADVFDERVSQISEALDITHFTVKLYKNYKRIVDQIADIEHICDSLVSLRTITLEEQQVIQKGKIIQDRNRCLLSKLMRKPLSAYTSFVKILSEDYINKDLATKIEQTPVAEHDIRRLKICLLKCKERQECRQTNKDKALEARIKNMEIQMADTIPQNRRDQIRIHLETWLKDKTFVTTQASESVCKFIRENNCVTVTGNSGVGKTTAVRHVAMVLLQDGYDVVPASTPEDILNFYNPKRKTLFVYDDLCGKYTLNQQYLNEWKLRLDAIKALLENSRCKIIATCRLQVFKDERFKDLSIFNSCECNLSSKELSLSSEEKSGLINAYCGEHAIDVSDKFNSDFFPLLCNLFKATNSTDVTQFFNNPFQFYDKEIEQLLKEDDTGKYKYCCLVLVVIFNNRLKEEFFSGIDSKDKKILKAVLSECELNKGTSPKSLLKSLKTLEGTFLVHEEGSYRTIHDKLFDYLSHYFRNKMIHILIDHADSQFICERFIWKTTNTDLTSDQTSDTDFPSGQTDTEFTINLPDQYIDDYIDRMIKDWSEGKVLDVFDNRNMESKEFTAKLLNHLNQLDKSKQSQLANMKVDNGYNDTTLMQSCFYGDVNFTRWIINHGVSVNHCRNDDTSPLYIACQNGHIDTVCELIKSGSDLQKCDNDGVSPLYIACYNGHIDTVRELIKSGSDLQKCDDDGWSPLYIACYNGHIDTVRELIKSGSDLQKCTDDGISPLYIACQYGHIDTVRELIKSGSDLHKCNNNGASPLYIACQNGHIDTVRELIKSGSDLHKCNNNGASPLYIACQNGHIDTVRELIKSGSDLQKCTDDGISPLYIACQYGHIDTVRELIKSGSDLHKCNNNGASPLYIACQNGHIDTVRELIKSGSDLQKCTDYGISPLYISCQYGHIDTVRELIKSGSDLHKCNNNGASPLYIACQNGHIDTVRELIKSGSDLQKCTDYGISPLYIACQYGHIDTVRELIKSGSDLHKCNNNGASPLYIACQNGHIDTVRELIKSGSDLQKCTDYGISPLYIACQYGHIDTVRELIKSGSDLHKCNNNGASPLYIACQNGHIDTVRELIKSGSDLQKCTDYGISPLYIACQYGHIDTVRELIKSGSDLHKCNNNGASPLYIACQNGHIDTVRELIKSGSDLQKCTDYGISPLYIACQYGHIDTVRELIKSGSDLHKCNNNGASPLYIACQNGHIDTVRELIKSGSDLQKCTDYGISPLYIACQYGHIDTVRELIKSGSDLHKCNNNGASPLYIACQNGHIDTVRELLKSGSDLQKCNNNGTSPLYIACQYGHIDTVRELIKSGSDLHKCNNNGASPLYIACQNGHIDTVRELLKSGSDLQKCTNDGASPLYIACQEGHIDTVRELIKWTVDINKCQHVGESPLFIAVVINNRKIVEVLLDNDSDVNKCAENKDKYCEAIVKYHTETVDSYMERTRDDLIFKYALPKVKQYIQETLGNNVMDLVVGSSPLHMACFMGLVDIVKLILEKNPNINITKEDGTTPLFLACQFGHTDVVKLMIEKGADDKVCRNDGKSPFDIALENGQGDVISLLTGHEKESV